MISTTGHGEAAKWYAALARWGAALAASAPGGR